MPLSFFRVLGSVIDDTVEYAAAERGSSVSEIYELIVAEANRNSDEWYSNRVPNLNYNCIECRIAYLYIVAAANAATFKYVLESDDNLREYVLRIAEERCQVRLCAFGAGPGTELLAMAKFCEEQQLRGISVDFQLLDKVQEWADSWYGIRDEVNNTFRGLYHNSRSRWPMIPSGNFLPCDVTQLNRFNRLGQVWNQDIYVVNYLLSEIFNDDPGMRGFLREVASHAPDDARFVFIERRGSIWQNRMTAIAREAGLILSPFIESQQQGLDCDDPSQLGAIYEAIGTRKRPRNRWNVVYSVGVKAG